MVDTGLPLAERLAAGIEEAEALAWYCARYCPGGSDDDASTAYRELLEALSAVRAQADEDSYRALMVAYRKTACCTYGRNEVHGRTVLDTLRKPGTRWGRLHDGRCLPAVIGAAFFLLALSVQALDAWTRSVLAAKQSAPAGEAAGSPGATELLVATLAASCIPFLVPVAWGALGACTALVKWISDRMSAMSFDADRMQFLTARIFLGAALALVLNILVFVEESAVGDVSSSFGFGPIVAAFLAGLFVQHVYGAFEALVRRATRTVGPGLPRLFGRTGARRRDDRERSPEARHDG